jgi:hypothetical protein
MKGMSFCLRSCGEIFRLLVLRAQDQNGPIWLQLPLKPPRIATWSYQSYEDPCISQGPYMIRRKAVGCLIIDSHAMQL